MTITSSSPLRLILSRLTPGDPTRSILPFIPRPLKWLALLVLLINARGLPLLWHIRVFRPVLYVRAFHALRNLVDSPTQRAARIADITRVGGDPFASETVFRTRATPDACDFNMHLSNSSYAMSYDMVRFKYVTAHFPLLYRDGGWMALGATHYTFAREIAMNARYEIRISLAGWDHKWIYMVARYITYPKSAKARANDPPAGAHASGRSGRIFPPLVTPAGSITPSPSLSPAPPPLPLGVPAPPCATVHCTAVSRLCAKIGRITIPPAIVIAANGFAIPPARFAELQRWRSEDDGARLKAFYAGGWRAVPAGERWWEEALGGEVEARRSAGLRALAGVGVAVEGAGEL